MNNASVRAPFFGCQSMQCVGLVVDRVAHFSKVLRRERKFRPAITLVIKALEFEPANKILLSELGLLHFKQKDYASARIHYGLALQQDPENPYLLRQIGLCHFRKKDNVNARYWFMKLAQLEPDNVQNLIYLGLCDYRLNHYRAAEGFFQKVLELEPENALARHFLNLISSQAKRAARRRT